MPSLSLDDDVAGTSDTSMEKSNTLHGGSASHDNATSNSHGDR